MRDWTDADVVFVSSLCFPDALLKDILSIAQGLKSGAKLLLLSLPDKSPLLDHFVVSKTLHCKMSWGRNVVYVATKR